MEYIQDFSDVLLVVADTMLRSAKKNRLSGFVPFIQISSALRVAYFECAPRCQILFASLLVNAKATIGTNGMWRLVELMLLRTHSGLIRATLHCVVTAFDWTGVSERYANQDLLQDGLMIQQLKPSFGLFFLLAVRYLVAKQEHQDFALVHISPIESQ